MISTEWPASSLSAIFYWIFCLPVLIFGLVFQVSINTLTLTLYYRFLIINSHFKTFFDCKAQITVPGTLKSFKNFVTDILVVSQLVMLSVVKKTKKMINFFEAKINNKLFCSYLIFFAFQIKNIRITFKFFVSVCVFWLCIFNLTMRNYGIINQPSERRDIINFVYVLSTRQLSPACTVLMSK